MSAPLPAPPSTTPKEVYGPAHAPIEIRLSNGGAGPTGILQVLASDFLKSRGHQVRIAWYQNHSAQSLQVLREGIVDMALVYEPKRAKEAIREGWASHYALIFYDHFVIAGPKANPAGLAPADSPKEAFSKIAKAARLAPEKGLFLSRDDHSSTNVKEQSIWRSIGLAPWKDNSAWYVKAHLFPKDTLSQAEVASLYILTDRGTWLSAPSLPKNLAIYTKGGKVLLNPCVALLQPNPKPIVLEFLRYLQSARAQQLIAQFKRGHPKGIPLFTRANQPEFDQKA
ncbi:MAG TPA: substrate-binding domain-containing protein, partial [Terrimicrobiaceae bacterium]